MEQLKEENEKLSAGLMELKNVQTKLMEEVETARAEKASLTKQQVSVERALFPPFSRSSSSRRRTCKI